MAQASGPGSADRRVAPRYPSVLKGLAAPRIVGAGTFEVVASNVSEGGLLVHTDQEHVLREGDYLAITFTPLLSGEPIVVPGAVVWLREGLAPRLGQRTFGFAFMGASPEAVERLVAPAREATELKWSYDKAPDLPPAPPVRPDRTLPAR